MQRGNTSHFVKERGFHGALRSKALRAKSINELFRFAKLWECVRFFASLRVLYGGT